MIGGAFDSVVYDVVVVVLVSWQFSNFIVLIDDIVCV